LGVYREDLRRAVLQAKSAGGEALARTLADLLLAARSAEFRTGRWDVVVPVPHHWSRRFSPRHAASETIAERLAARLGLPYDGRLVRKTRITPPQAGTAPSVRRRQQRGAFAAANANGLRILLVDDVLTTGATADEVSKVLRAAGAASITVAVIARGIGDRD
jgi:predicted amidophosphoribosyltransferase